MLMPLIQREVDIFFGSVSHLLKKIAAAASAGSYIKIKSFTIQFDTGQSFKVCVDQIVYNSIDDPKFMISIPFEVENMISIPFEVKNEQKKTQKI